MNATLVRPMISGPVDVIADVHGELDALESLMLHLGYNRNGSHPDGRHLIFVGDLVDRGPDSVGVVATVRELIENGVAQCVLGNHELNIMRHDAKSDNAWFFALPAAQQQSLQAFFTTLPVALERNDLRVVHACWHDPAIELLRQETEAIRCYQQYAIAIRRQLDAERIRNRIDREIRLQNHNPIKRVTSGTEHRAQVPVNLNGELRHTLRERWWLSYTGPFCVIGHYWRGIGPTPSPFHLFDEDGKHALLGLGHVMCIDYSVGWRYRERASQPVGYRGPFQLRLTALQYPEMKLIFDDGSHTSIDAISLNPRLGA